MSDADRSKWDERYRTGAYAERRHPSTLLRDWIDEVPRGRALDVACGAGRNALFLAARGFAVEAVDISRAGLARGRRAAAESGLQVHWIEHDLDQPLALQPGYTLVLVVRFLDLPLIRRLADLLAPGGYLICEEHLRTQAEVIGPGNPAYRVAPGALREAAAGLDVLLYEEGMVEDPDGRTAALAQLVARRRGQASPPP
jgi:SAM-dependent methyltransferase